MSRIFINPHDGVENEGAWCNAAEATIKARAAAKRRRAFEQEPDAEEILAFLKRKAFNWAGENDWPSRGFPEPRTFVDRLQVSMEDWGAPSAKQLAVLRDMLAKDKARQAERRERDLASQHIGTVGERLRGLELTVSFQTGFETQFGFTTVTGFRDAAGNVFIHKGTNPGCERGDRVTVAATVKEHGERDGVKQTILSRPKVEVVERAA